MFDIKQLKHDNARIAEFLATEQTTGRIPIRLGSRCMASILEPTVENAQATRRVAGKLVKILTGKPALVEILYQGRRYIAEAEGLSGWFPQKREAVELFPLTASCLWEDYPEAEQCEWQDVYPLLQRRRAAVYESPNAYTLLEQLLSVTV